MTTAVAPALSDVYTAMLAFVQFVIGSNVPVLQGIQNRAAIPPPVPGFVIMQIIERHRLMTNLDVWDFSDPEPSSMTFEQDMQVTMQLDFYGASSFDWATEVSTLFRDDVGVTALAPNCTPLYADDARMMPLINAEAQYEQRWSLDCKLQYNPVVTFVQQFADALDVDLISVDERYPPT